MNEYEIDTIIVDTLNISTIYLKHNIVELNGSNITDWLGVILPFIATMLALWWGYYQLKKTIEQNKSQNTFTTNTYVSRELDVVIGELIFELQQESYTKLYEKEYASEAHHKREARVLSYLNEKIPLEKELSDCVQKFKTEELENVHEWIKEIKSLKDKICYSYVRE